ncbi:MAG: redoxin domain-containing protein [Candidatus Didemnitutus sp.]|nr:redoxin domain-containing protein [Candidatus Didemnitutus sp.]
MNRITSLLSLAAALSAAAIAHASLEVGQSAPDFTLTDLNGQPHSLSSFKGKTVVLEWVNPDCPFVRKHYNKSTNMQNTQKAAAADGVVWLQINSAAPGNEGDYDVTKAKAWQSGVGAVATAYFRDQDGKVGHLYDARTTPHLFIITPDGTLAYQGGIDSIRSANPDDIAKATNYVTTALTELKSGKPVTHASTAPYGCSVKY